MTTILTETSKGTCITILIWVNVCTFHMVPYFLKLVCHTAPTASHHFDHMYYHKQSKYFLRPMQCNSKTLLQKWREVHQRMGTRSSWNLDAPYSCPLTPLSVLLVTLDGWDVGARVSVPSWSGLELFAYRLWCTPSTFLLFEGGLRLMLCEVPDLAILLPLPLCITPQAHCWACLSVLWCSRSAFLLLIQLCSAL